MKHQTEFVICDRFIEEYERIGKKLPGCSSMRYGWRNYVSVPSTYYIQRAALDGCDVYYILTGRRKVGTE